MTSVSWNNKGQVALDEGDLESALECFRKATELEPSWSVPFFNLGLTYKFLRNWEPCRVHTLTAHQLKPQDEAAIWNLAISSVATGHWETARLAFQKIGLDVPEHAGPWRLDLGPTPIRVNPEESPEVVWAQRIDPVRAVLENVPLPECERRYGDVVLHDGAPNGYRTLGGREIPVFDELMLLERSSYATFEVVLGEGQSYDSLSAVLEEHGMTVENWSRSVRFLCRACSEGRPHESHDHDLPETAQSLTRLGVAAEDEGRLRELLAGWEPGSLQRVQKVY